jgi:excisionase family DNA binding protein
VGLERRRLVLAEFLPLDPCFLRYLDFLLPSLVIEPPWLCKRLVVCHGVALRAVHGPQYDVIPPGHPAGWPMVRSLDGKRQWLDTSCCFLMYHSISRYMAIQGDTPWGYAASVMEAEWLTVDEACELLRVSRPTIYRFIKDGRLAPYEIPGFRGIRFKKKDLDELFTPINRTAAVVAIAVAAKASRPRKRKSKRT